MWADSWQRDHLARFTHAIIDFTSVVFEDWHQELPVEPLVPHYFRSDADVMPVLLTLDSLSDAHLDLLCENLEQAKDSPYMLLLSCLLHVAPDTHPKILAHHLTQLLMLDGPGREGVNCLLRYHHKSIFLHLLRILSPKRVRQLFGPVSVWSVPFQQEWTDFPAPDIAGPIPTYWAIDAEQAARLGRIDLINNVLIRWKEKTGLRWASVEAFHADAENVDRILCFAGHHYRLRANEDLLLFAEHALLHGEDFHTHPTLQPLLQTVQEKGWGYAAGSARITSEDWKAIAAASNRRLNK